MKLVTTPLAEDWLRSAGWDLPPTWDGTRRALDPLNRGTPIIRALDRPMWDAAPPEVAAGLRAWLAAQGFERFTPPNLGQNHRVTITAASPLVVELGDRTGHDFHGNQHTGGIGGGDEPTSHEKRLTAEEHRRIYGGLTAKDYPYGRIPEMMERNAQALYPNPPHSDPPSPEPNITDLGFRFGWTPEQETEARHSLAQKIKESEPTVRMPMAAFKAMLEDGTIRNQWETGRTGAATGKQLAYEPARGNAETLSLGVARDASPEERPVYGYLAPADGRGDFLHVDDPADRAAAIDYLPVGKDVREDILADPDKWYLGIAPSSHNAGEGRYVDVYTADWVATRVEGDPEYLEELRHESFYPLGDGNGNLNDAVVFGYANSEYAANQYGDVQIRLRDDTLDTATVTGGDSIDSRLVGMPVRLAEAEDERIPIAMTMTKTTFGDGTMAEYAELQLHEHPTLADVEHVTFTGSKPTRAIAAQLEEAGITYSVDPAPRLSRTLKVPIDDIVAKGTVIQLTGTPAERAKQLWELK